jgi:hypothetical protein
VVRQFNDGKRKAIDETFDEDAHCRLSKSDRFQRSEEKLP